MERLKESMAMLDLDYIRKATQNEQRRTQTREVLNDDSGMKQKANDERYEGVREKSAMKFPVEIGTHITLEGSKVEGLNEGCMMFKKDVIRKATLR